MKSKKTFCQICNVQCGMIAHLEEGKVMSVEGDPEDPSCRGELCIKGQHAPDILYAQDRLRYPLMRECGHRDGAWRRASWTEAVDFISTRLAEVRQRHGPESLAFYMGSTNMIVDTMMVRRFARCFGTANINGTWGVCVGPKIIGYESTFGRPRAPWCDLRHARYILLWGTNPPVSHIHRYYAITDDIRAAQQGGAKLVVIDPRRTAMAAEADRHLQIRPGTDLALALAMIHIIIAEELYDKEFVDRYTHGLDQLAEHVKPYTASWAAGITDIPAETIRAVAREFAQTQPASLERREGVQHNINATQTLRAMAILLALTGNVDVSGGLTFTEALTLQDISLPTDLSEPRPAFWADRFLLVDSFASGLPEAILTESPYPIRALIVLKGNPMACFANTQKTAEALKKLDLLVVHDLFETETTELADVVLPGCTFFEKGEISPKSLRNDRRAIFAAPVIEPLYESVPGWQCMCMLAHRLGYGDFFDYRDEQAVFNAILQASDLTPAEVVVREPSRPAHGQLLKNGFSTPTGKIELYSTLLEQHGHDPLPTINPQTRWHPSDEYPYCLITGFRQQAFSHSRHRNIDALRRHHPDPVAEIGRAVAEGAGVADGDWIEVRTTAGRAILKAAVSDTIHPRTVCVPHGWRGEQNANRLTDDQVCDPVVGAPAYKGLHCTVRRAREPKS